jgi:hypothetical protein
LIAGLKTENERLKAQVQQLAASETRRESNVSTTSATSSSSSTSEQQSQQLSRLIDLYREMTGLEMEVSGDFAWKCALTGRLGTLHFDLSFDEDALSFEYVPRVPQSSPLVKSLPAYLMEEISFGPEQLQLFLWRAMNFLMTVTGSNKNSNED